MMTHARKLWQAFCAWRAWREAVAAYEAPQPQWTDEDRRAWTLFCQSRTGIKLRACAMATERDLNARAVLTHQDQVFACGYAAGARGMSALLFVTFTAPSEPQSETPEPTAEPGEADLLEKLSP